MPGRFVVFPKNMAAIQKERLLLQKERVIMNFRGCSEEYSCEKEIADYDAPVHSFIFYAIPLREALDAASEAINALSLFQEDGGQTRMVALDEKTTIQCRYYNQKSVCEPVTATGAIKVSAQNPCMVMALVWNYLSGMYEVSLCK